MLPEASVTTRAVRRPPGSFMDGRVFELEDFRTLARRRLPRMVFDFIDGGVDGEAGLQRNRDAFAAWTLLPRYLRHVEQRDQSLTLWGRTWTRPVGIAPMGLAGLFRPGADLMMAQAAAAAEANKKKRDGKVGAAPAQMGGENMGNMSQSMQGGGMMQ